MTDRPFAAIKGEVKPEDPVVGITALGFPFPIQECQRIYYPYDWYVFRYRARTLLGATTTLISCLVDTRTRVCATADPFRLENRTAGDDRLLDRRENRDTTLGLARRYADYAARQKHKALVLPRVDIVESRPVYKPFWVVDCNPCNAATKTVLIDGVTGDYCGLADQPYIGLQAQLLPGAVRSKDGRFPNHSERDTSAISE